jgi:hypothetical protein
MLTFTRGLKKNNIYKGCNRVVDEKKVVGKIEERGKTREYVGVISKINMKRFERVLLFWGNQHLKRKQKIVLSYGMC